MIRKINKAQARKIWNDGGNIFFTPCKLRVNTGFNPVYFTSKTQIETSGYNSDFDRIVNLHEYYNCNNETGRYCAYYTDK